MNTHTVIIGGGISGLSAANFLYKKTSNFIIVVPKDKGQLSNYWGIEVIFNMLNYYVLVL